MARPPGILPCGCTGGPRVEQRAPGTQKQEHPTPTLPCTQGRETANRKPAVPCCCCRFWRARCTPALVGPLGGGEAGTTRPRSGRGQGWTRLFARAGDGMDAGVEATQERLPEPARKARPRLADLPGRMPGKRQPGRPFSLVTFSLATQRESNSGAGKRSKPLCRFRKLEKSKSPLSPNPSPASGRGEQSPPTEAGRWWPPLGSPAIHGRMRTMLVMWSMKVEPSSPYFINSNGVTDTALSLTCATEPSG